MENMETAGSAEAVSSSEVAAEPTQDIEAAPEAGAQTEPGATADQPTPEEANGPEILELMDGKKAVALETFEKTQKGFQARIDALTAKLKDPTALIERLTSDPAAMEQLKAAFSGNAPAQPEGDTAADGNNDPLPNFNAWVQNNIQDPQQALFMKSYTQPLLQDIDRAVQSYVKETLATELSPFKKYIANVETDGFYKTNPDAKTFETQIIQTMKQYQVPLQKAWHIVAAENGVYVKKSAQAAPPANKNRPPVAGPSARTVPTRTKPATFEEGIMRGLERAGMK